MARPDPVPTQLERDLADLKLLEIAKRYREVLDEAAHKGSSMLEVLATLFDVDNTLATALIDRLMHHGEALVIKGDSYRMKDKPSDPASA